MLVNATTHDERKPPDNTKSILNARIAICSEYLTIAIPRQIFKTLHSADPRIILGIAHEYFIALS